jgi:adenosine deaminase
MDGAPAVGFDSDVVDEEWLRSLPKAEVHVHLEGTFTAPDLEQLARQAGVALPRPLDTLFDVSNLADFLDLLDWGCSLVRTAEQVAASAYRMAEREARSGVAYADVIVNPTHWPAWRDRLGEFLAALDEGFTRAEADGMTSTGICVSLLRRQSADDATGLVEWLADRRPARVVALSIDGNEAAAGRTGPRFAEAFAAAAAAGLHRTVHAGESSGPEGVWDAIDLLGAERIDHGVRAVEDAALVEELVRRRIPLGIAPTSNVRLGVCASYRDHPLEQLRRAGVRVSVNTDDPALLGTRLEWEYARIGREAHWGPADYLGTARTSIEAAFCTDEVRQELRDRLDGFAKERGGATSRRTGA